MIQGRVSDQGVPSIELEILGRRWTAIIDSGFNGDIELPTELKNGLQGRFVGRTTSLLAAGQVIEEEVFLVTLPFDGDVLDAEATFAAVDEILIGTGLMRRHRLIIDFPQKALSLEQS